MADVVCTYVARYFASITRRPNELFRGMARHPELCCLALAFVITIIIKYGSSFKGKPVTLAAKQPQYMFAPASLVMDSPRGSLMPLIQVLNQEELVFVMYYAPWCSKSQTARAEFIKAANFFGGEIKFAAVNCWWPEGDCRKRYKFLMFPVFMVYHTKLDGYRYFGLHRAEQMIQFVENILKPVSVVHSPADTMEMIAKYDTVVLGYFNISTLDNVGAYRQFYYASMRIVEKDPIQPAKFLVVTQADVADIFNLTKLEDIVLLRLTNSSLMYPFVNNVTSSNLLTWVLENKELKTVRRLSPEGMKSQALALEINKGPAFIMFHVENPLFDTEQGLRVVRDGPCQPHKKGCYIQYSSCLTGDHKQAKLSPCLKTLRKMKPMKRNVSGYKTKLKDVALLYRECMIHPAFRNIRAAWLDRFTKQIRRYQLMTQICDQSKLAWKLARYRLPCCISALVHSANASSKVCSVCRSYNTVCRILPNHLSSALNKSRPLPLSCHSIILNYSWADKLSVCCYLRNDSSEDFQLNQYSAELNFSSEHQNIVYLKNETIPDSPKRRLTDRYVRHQLERLPRRLCDRLSLEKQQGLKSVWTPELESEDADLEQKKHYFSHISCQSNKSLNFYAVDSQNHWMFYDALGMKPYIIDDRPVAVLFDKQNEQHYIMNGSFTVSNSMSFILDFEQGKLKRHRQSHSFQHFNCDAQGQVCVRELCSETFLEAVMEEDKDVIGLIYAHWCGFCQTLSHTFLRLAEYFSSSKAVSFVRINGALNDLPWEYTFDSYPSIIFFPARRKADSALFPAHKEMTLSNLVHFVLQHTTLDTRLHLAADVCSEDCINNNLLRSNSLLQMLKRKQASLQKKLQELSDSTSEPTLDTTQSISNNYYEKIGADFLNTQLREIQSKIGHVTRLIEYLESHKESVLSKQELVDLFSLENSSGA